MIKVGGRELVGKDAPDSLLCFIEVLHHVRVDQARGNDCDSAQ